MAKSIGEETRLAIENLSPWIPAYGRHAIIQRLLEKYQQPATDANSASQAYQDIAMKLYEIVEGGYYAHEIIQEIINSYNGASQEVIDNIRGFTRFTVVDNTAYVWRKEILNQQGTLEDINLGREAGINASVTSPTRQSPNLVAIEMMDPDLGLAARDSSSVSIFTSLIPTLELSRCIPYINIRFTTSGSNSSETPAATRPSISTFLGGFGSKLELNSIGSLGYSSYVGENSEIQPSSMELFLSPQTMTPSPDSQAFSERGNVPTALDRFRPFMSLKGLSFSVVPSKGFMSYKSGKMEITLHDRSRLRDISSLVTPGVYQDTEFDIEYGWSHPEGDSSKNSFGAFLNGLKVREKYGIVNSTFSFGDSGQVDISVNIAMKGAKTVETIDISGRESLTKEIEGIISKLSELVNIQTSNNPDKATSIFGETIVEAISTSDKSVSLNEEKLREIRQSISKFDREGKIPNTIVNSLRSIFGEDGKIDENQKSVDELIGSAFEDVKKRELFPFSNESSRNKIEKISSETVSFGNLLLHFIGKPLAKSGQFEEVQFIFHPMNHKASWMRNLSIAKFPIDISGQDSGAEKRLKEFLKENLKMSAAQFFNFISSEFISDPSTSAYGMHDFFKQKLDSDGNPTGEYEKKEQYEGAAGFDEQENRLKNAGINDGNLVYVKPEMYPECVPYAKDPSKTILRLHVVDSACKSYNTLYELLRSVRLDDISTLGIEDDNPSNLWTDNDKDICPEYPYLKAKKESLFSLIKERTTKLSISESSTTPSAANTTPAAGSVPPNDPSKSSNLIDDVGKVLEGKSLTEVKKFISEGMPTIYYGSSGGAITNIGISSLADSKLATVNIINMTKTSAEAPDADRNRNLPLFVMPTQCTVDMIGCPILQYGQFFFLDLKTGTTADNMYWVTGLDHKLGPDGFTTSAKLTLVDAYGGYRNSARRLDFLSTALASKYGLPIPERKGGGGRRRGTTVDFDATSFLGLDKFNNSQVEELSGKAVMAVLDKNFKILQPVGSSRPKYSPLFVSEYDSTVFDNDSAAYVIQVRLPSVSDHSSYDTETPRPPYRTNLLIWARADEFQIRTATTNASIVPFATMWSSAKSQEKAARNFSAAIKSGKSPLVQYAGGDWFLTIALDAYLDRLNAIDTENKIKSIEADRAEDEAKAAKNAEAEEKRKAEAARRAATANTPKLITAIQESAATIDLSNAFK